MDVLDTSPELEEEHRNILKGFFSTFKAADEHLKFVFLTGVTKFSQISVFSGFNQPKDISINTDYESLCGITQEELENYFAEPIEEMAESEKCTREEMLLRLKEEYDGYHFGKKLTDIYNPFSILNAFTGFYRLQSGCGAAIADDLSERIFDDKRLEPDLSDVFIGLSESRSKEFLYIGVGRIVFREEAELEYMDRESEEDVG